MHRLLFRFILLAAFGAGLVTAQTAGSGAALRERMTREEAALLGVHDLRIAADLNLTADQQAKIRAAFEEAAEARWGVVDQTHDLRNQLASAVKAGDQAMIDQISEALGAILQKQISVHAKTIATVYGVLTPAQKTKLEEDVRHSLGLLEKRREGRDGL